MRALVAVAMLVAAGCDDGPDEAPTPVQGDLRFEGRLVVPNGVTAPAGDVHVVLMVANLRDTPVPIAGEVYRTLNVGPIAAGDEVPFAFELERDPQDLDLHFPDADAETEDFRVGALQVGAYVDTDGDGRPSAGDDFVGSDLELLVLAVGDRDEDDEALVLDPGWNRVRFVYRSPVEDGVDHLGDDEHVTDYELRANLLPIERDMLRGTIVPAVGHAVSVDLRSAVEFYTGAQPRQATLATTSADATQANATFRFAALSAPPPEHLFQQTGSAALVGSEIAVAYGVAYDDLNRNGALDPGTEPFYGTSVDAGDDARFVAWFEPVDFSAVVYDDLYGQAAGWMLFGAGPDGSERLAWNEGLVIDAPGN